MKGLGKLLVTIGALVVLGVTCYVLYAYGTYYRLEDSVVLDVEDSSAASAEPDREYTLLSYNVGFGAYSADYSFFMDGGTESRARSEEAVRMNLGGALETVRTQAPDFLFLQEVDVDATRSYHVDETDLVRRALPGYGAVFAQNYDSPYLLWPLNQPHGASRAGILTLSLLRMDSGLRRSLPVETGFSKFYDLDRCYSVVRVPVSNGRTLCLYNVHLSAYTPGDSTVVADQLQMLLEDMAGEYAAGNYAVCGGDFNKDLLGSSAKELGVPPEDGVWARSFPVELLPEGVTLHAPRTGSVPSCRSASMAYDPKTTPAYTLDGFLVSDNVTVTAAAVIDTGFAYSDHNPVALTFALSD